MDKDKESVSVIVLTYGKYAFLERSLESILCQTYPIEQIIVSDDGSGCRFPEELIFQYPNVKFVQQSLNYGTVAHMNLIAGALQTDFVKFFGVGDCFKNKKSLEKMIEFAKSNNNLVVTSQAVVYNEKGVPLYYYPGARFKRIVNKCAYDQLKTLMCENTISAPASIFRIDFFRKENGFDESYRLLEDWPTWLKLTRKGEQIGFYNYITCCYYLNGSSAESGNAYASKILREDMYLCYKKDILPFKDVMNEREKRIIDFNYDRLGNVPDRELISKYGCMALKTIIKGVIKKCLCQ